MVNTTWRQEGHENGAMGEGKERRREGRRGEKRRWWRWWRKRGRGMGKESVPS